LDLQSVHLPLLQFSSETLPPRDRVAVWREVYGKQIVRLDLEPMRDLPFQPDFKLRALPGLNTFSGTVGGTRDQRTAELLSDGNDDLGLMMILDGTTIFSQLGREVTLRGGDAVLVTCAEAGTMFWPHPVRHLGINVPRAALQARVSNVGDAIARPVPRDSGALRLLKNYLRLLDDDSCDLTAPALREAVVNHVHDLTACIIEEMKGNEAPAEIGGMRAARLHALKEDIAANILSRDLTLDTVAARQNISPSYIRKLLETDGTNFTELVLEGRLLRARRLLSDPSYASYRISDIALVAGFGDLSYFNRTFRRRFGYVPSEVRLGKLRT
jgi:AraC-like DNA-binding protein